MSPNPLSGCGAIVTGGTSGLGLATARGLAQAGATVVIAGRNAEAGNRLASELGGGAIFAPTDVTDEAQVAAAVAVAARAPRGLRLAVSCAGMAIISKTVGRGGPHPVESFRQVLDVNLVGAFNLLRLSAAEMVDNEPDPDGGRGAVVLTSSVGAFEGQMGQVAYAAAKGGVRAMILPAARDLSTKGVRVAGIAPGVFNTPFMDVLSEEAKASVAAAVPFPSRLGHPEEFASLVLEIALNPMVNGDTYRLDGALRLGVR